MDHWKWITGMLLAGSLLGGCAHQTTGSTRGLGAVPYEGAFAAAVKTMSQHFSIEASDASAGTIRTQPKPVQAEPDRLLGGYPARQVATLHLRREDGQVVARLSVALQRQRAGLYRRMRMAENNYDTVPNETPAQKEAATTIEQNQSWETQKYAHDIERRILEELYAALHGPAEP
ncbi:MAG: hypothetical protein KAX78_11760 [Phycisphaerae bacterium]|nr:hypothetical protein [Phycisphaerae bacterium]